MSKAENAVAIHGKNLVIVGKRLNQTVQPAKTLLEVADYLKTVAKDLEKLSTQMKD